MCVLAFSRLIALHLLLLHALVFTNTCAELDKLMHVDDDITYGERKQLASI